MANLPPEKQTLNSLVLINGNRKSLDATVPPHSSVSDPDAFAGSSGVPALIKFGSQDLVTAGDEVVSNLAQKATETGISLFRSMYSPVEFASSSTTKKKKKASSILSRRMCFGGTTGLTAAGNSSYLADDPACFRMVSKSIEFQRLLIPNGSSLIRFLVDYSRFTNKSLEILSGAAILINPDLYADDEEWIPYHLICLSGGVSPDGHYLLKATLKSAGSEVVVWEEVGLGALISGNAMAEVSLLAYD